MLGLLAFQRAEDGLLVGSLVLDLSLQRCVLRFVTRHGLRTYRS